MKHKLLVMTILAAVLVAQQFHTTPTVYGQVAEPSQQTERDASARQKAARMIAEAVSVTSDQVTYMHTMTTPYDSRTRLELYTAKQMEVLLDPRTNTIVRIGSAANATPSNPSQSAQPTTYSTQQLEARARTVVGRYSTASLDKLRANHQQKPIVTQTGGLASKQPTKQQLTTVNFSFFRWEDRNRALDVKGTPPFIQVGFSPDGTLLNYVNTLGLLGADPNTVTTSLAGVYVYANGGNYYTRYGPSQWWSTAWNQGFCYLAGWCNPKNMEYTWSKRTLPADNYARWKPIYTKQDGNLFAFVPCIHAGTRAAKYNITYASGSYQGIERNQAPVCNDWLFIGRYYSIEEVVLTDVTTDDPIAEVGFDELKIEY